MFGARRLATGESGSAMFEFLLVLPMLFILGAAIWEFGRLLDAQVVATNAAREGARFASLNTLDATLSTDVQGRVMDYLQEAYGSSRVGTSGAVGQKCAATTDLCIDPRNIQVTFLDPNGNATAAAPGNRVQVVVPVTADLFFAWPGYLGATTPATMTLTGSASMQLE
jgi:Flp pilus assembly protein TadG